jgi:hypothetical protein
VYHYWRSKCGDLIFSLSQLKSCTYFHRLSLLFLSNNISSVYLFGYEKRYGVNISLLQFYIIALLVTNIFNVVLRLLWIRSWWQLIEIVQSLQFYINTVDLVSAAFNVQFVRFFINNISVLSKRSICELVQFTIRYDPIDYPPSLTFITSLFLSMIPGIFV